MKAEGTEGTEVNLWMKSLYAYKFSGNWKANKQTKQMIFCYGCFKCKISSNHAISQNVHRSLRHYLLFKKNVIPLIEIFHLFFLLNYSQHFFFVISNIPQLFTSWGNSKTPAKDSVKCFKIFTMISGFLKILLVLK